jgi:hypothetical protein
LREDCKGFGALRRTYFALVCTGAVGNSLAFVLTLHTVSTGRVVEASPHLGELMSYPYTAWLLGQSIFLGLYVTVFFAPGLTMHQRVVIAASITGLSLSNLFHDLTVFQGSHYLHIIATLTPLALTQTVISLWVLAVRDKGLGTQY